MSNASSQGTRRRDVSSYRELAGSFLVCLSCRPYISTNSFAVVASSGPLSSRQRPVNRGNRIARPAPGRRPPHAQVWIGLTVISAPPGVVRGVKGLRHEPLAPGLEGFIEERFGLLHVVRHPDGRGTDLVARVDDTFEGFPPLRVRTCGQVLLRTQEAIECEEGDGEFLRHPL